MKNLILIIGFTIASSGSFALGEGGQAGGGGSAPVRDARVHLDFSRNPLSNNHIIREYSLSDISDIELRNGDILDKFAIKNSPFIKIENNSVKLITGPKSNIQSYMLSSGILKN
jgi:hypothetical protein